MAKELFNRYIWLVDTIYRAKRITFEEINEKWIRNSMSEGMDIPLKTFHSAVGCRSLQRRSFGSFTTAANRLKSYALSFCLI